MRDPTTSADRRRRTPQAWSPWARRGVTLLIVFHVAAVMIAPWSNPPPSSDLSRSLAYWIRPYLKAMSLENGYRFFAPNPDPSHLIRYEWLREGKPIDGGVFPDRRVHWPRLLYHRHFMIAEMIAAQMPPQIPPEELARWDQEERQIYERDRAIPARLLRSVAQRLLREEPEADSIRLFLVTHLIPAPLDVLQGRSLQDPAMYEEVPLGEFRKEGK